MAMGGSIHDSLLTALVLASWFYIFRIIFTMPPCDARNLAEYCSKYVIPEDEISQTELLTSGNALVVSRAEYRGQKVVLKRWHAATVSDTDRISFTRRLVRELDRWRSLLHPNISPVYGLVLHISNLPAVVAPLYRTVNQVLADDPSTDVLSLLQGIAAGLSYLHSRDPPIAHGDLKGSTILVSPTGTPLLSPICTSSIPQPPDWAFHGVDDARWLAPEVMDPTLRPIPAPCSDSECASQSSALGRGPDDASGRGFTTASDVYSFGMLAYEMFTRARPFATTTWTAAVVVLVVIEGKRPPRPSLSSVPQLTDEMWTLIEACWKQDWLERPSIDTVAGWLSVIGRTRALGAQCHEAVEG